MRPRGVVSAFDVPLRHLAFDDPGCGSEASGGVEPPEESVQEDDPARPVPVTRVTRFVLVSVVRGEKRPVGRWSDG